MQDQEVGDGTTSVVIFAAELLQKAHGLVRHKIHPTSIISGFRLAMREVSILLAVLHLESGGWLDMHRQRKVKHRVIECEKSASTMPDKIADN